MDFLESMQSRFDRKISLFSVGYARNLISNPLFVQSPLLSDDDDGLE